MHFYLSRCWRRIIFTQKIPTPYDAECKCSNIFFLKNYYFIPPLIIFFSILLSKLPLAVFGSCKSISEKYFIFRKGKCFHVFGCISKNFPKNIFWCLEKKKEETKPRKTKNKTQKNMDKTQKNTARSREASFALIAISRSIDRDRRGASRSTAWLVLRKIVLSLSHSPFARLWALFARPQFRKSFEVKIGTEMNFRGQHCYFTVNWKWFSGKSIFCSCQTCGFYRKSFLEMIFNQFKHSLSEIVSILL